MSCKGVFLLGYVVFCFLVGICSGQVASPLDPKFVVGISSTPLPGIEGNYVVMTGAKGNKFHCSIPQATTTLKTEKQNSRAVAIDKLGHKYTAGQCLLQVDGYWTYRVCPFNKVEQFHDATTGPLFSLGAYRSPLSTNLSDDSSPYHQQYEDGTDGRQSTITYVCGSGKDSIRKISENIPLQYDITISSEIACFDTKKPRSTISTWLHVLDNRCLTYSESWWDYEFCYLKHIRQFHTETLIIGESNLESDKKTSQKPVKTAEYYLGIFPAKEPSMETIDALSQVQNDTDQTFAFVSQKYVSGTACNIEGDTKNRETIVYFMCEDSLSSHDARILSIRETSTCSYLVRVGVGGLCSHPAFAPAQAPVSQIICHPAPKEEKAVDPEVVDESHESEVVDDSHESEVVDESRESKVVDESHESEVVDESHESEVVDESHEPEVVDESHESEVVDKSHESEVVDKSHESEVVDELHESEVVDELHESDETISIHEEL